MENNLNVSLTSSEQLLCFVYEENCASLSFSFIHFLISY